MPLVYQQNINATIKLGIWHIVEEESFFVQRVKLTRDISHPHKRLQHLAGRYLLQVLDPKFPNDKIMTEIAQKPFLTDNAYHFSISHCGSYAAAIISTNDKVGIDIELISEKAKRVNPKFLSTQELTLLKQCFQGESFYSIAWSIKEAMYKWAGVGGIDFKKNLIIQQVHVNRHEGTAVCIFTKNGATVTLKVHFLIFNQNSIAWLYTPE